MGDFLHSRLGPNTATQLLDWQARHQHVQMGFIAGNHDPHVGLLARNGWRLLVKPKLGGITLAHEPCERPDTATVCGQFHPVYHVRAGKLDTLRAPVFWVQPHQLVFPAFGAFTGGYPINPNSRDKLYIIGPQQVVPWRRHTAR